MTAEDKRTEQRVPVVLRIKLRYTNVDTFISKFAVNISRGGMFISSRAPKPTGTVVKFELREVVEFQEEYDPASDKSSVFLADRKLLGARLMILRDRAADGVVMKRP